MLNMLVTAFNTVAHRRPQGAVNLNVQVWLAGLGRCRKVVAQVGLWHGCTVVCGHLVPGLLGTVLRSLLALLVRIAAKYLSQDDSTKKETSSHLSHYRRLQPQR